MNLEETSKNLGLMWLHFFALLSAFTFSSAASALTSVNADTVFMPTSGLVTLPLCSNTIIYDSGGPNGDYAPSSGGGILIPSPAFGSIVITGSYSIQCFGNDYFSLYSAQTPSPPSDDTYLGAYNCNGTISFTSTPGQSLIIYFVSDSAVQSSGFELCVTYTDMNCGIVNMPLDSGYQFPCGTGLNLFDDGGESNNYAPNNTSYVELTNSGYSTIQLQGTYDLGPGDSISVYQGTLELNELITSFIGSGNIDLLSWNGMDFIIYFYSDAVGESAGIDLTVTYNGFCACWPEEIVAPNIIQIPPTIYSVADSDCGAHIIWTEPLGYDNCTNVTFESNYSPGDYIIGPQNTITYTFFDAWDNSTTATIDVVFIDVTPPIISIAEPEITSTSNIGECGVAVAWQNPIFSDACDENVVFWSTHNSGDYFDIGDHTVTFYAIDMAGNVDSANMQIHVIDNISPLVTCPSDTTICAGSSLDYAGVLVTNSCENWTSAIQTSGWPMNEPYPADTITNCFEASYSVGNVSQCCFTVASVASINLPEEEITSVSTASECGTIVTWPEPAISNICGQIAEVWSTHNSGDYFELGDHNVTYYSMDMNGNIDSVIIQIHVIDNDIAPVITCPSDTTICAGTSLDYAGVLVIDNCENTLPAMQTSGWPANESYPESTITNCFQGSDSDGNTSYCCFTVTALALPSVSLTAPNDTLCFEIGSMTLIGEPVGGTYSGPGVMNGTIDASVAGIGTFNYTYAFTDLWNCSAEATIPIVVDACIGISEEKNNRPTIIYPNPANDKISLHIEGQSTVLIYDMTSRLIHSSTAYDGLNFIHVGHLTRGTYNLQISNHQTSRIETLQLILK
jgi:hypothetical protein